MKLTPWFPASLRPVREGVYQIRTPEWPGKTFWSHWNGKRWGLRCSDCDFAYKDRAHKARGPVTLWRGLLKWKAWAIFTPDGKLHCIHNGFSIYRTKREAMLDCDTGCTVRRVVIREGK